ncbi:MAG: MATE family efflux transporter [Cyanobacteria bacterium P01_F01_bin.143]
MTSQKQPQITDEILQGNLVKLMFKLSIPSILGVLIVSLNTFIDALFAGRFINATTFAGIALAFPFTGIVEGLAALIGVGSASILSRAIGSGDLKTQSKIFSNFIVLSIIASFFITIIGYEFGQELITLMGGTGEVALEGTKYLTTYILGSIIFIAGTACGEILIAEGQIRITTISMCIFVAVNVFLNYIFIITFDWGASGLALATIIAMIVSSINSFSYFFRGKSFIPVNLKKMTFARDLFLPILSVGIAELFFPVINLLQDSVVFNSLSTYGTSTDIAFFGAAGQVIALAFIPVSGLAQALQPVIGMNYGAKKTKRIKKAYFVFASCGIILLLLIWVPLQLSPKTFLSFILPDTNFTNDDLFHFRILSIITPIWPLATFSNTLFLSLGKGGTILFVLLLRTIGLKIPMVLFFARIYEIKGVYYGLCFADLIFMIVVIVLTIKEFDELKKIKV